MNEKRNKNRVGQICAALQDWWVYLKQVFTYAITVAVLVGASFMLTDDFSAKTYSDRLFTVGILITLLGVFVFVTIAGTRRRLGIPTLAKNEEQARKILDHTEELREKAEKRYDIGAQVWAVGIACMVVSIIAYYLLTVLEY